MQNSVLDCIGWTPLVRLARFAPSTNRVSLAAKLEYLNPGGSVKDRIGLAMIADAEQRGLLSIGGTIVEPTAGNTGIGLALAAAVRGYSCVFVIPERFSWEKQELLRALGAEVVQTPTSRGIEGAIERAHQIASERPGAVVMQQFANPANALAHYRSTGPEIWEQTEGKVDVVVLGAGTGGTFTGITRYLKERNLRLHAVIVQPEGAVMGHKPGSHHKIEGIGIDDLKTVPVLDAALIDQVVAVSDADAHQAVQDLARQEGMLVGSSAGAAAWAARSVARDIESGRLQVSGRSIVTLFPDGSDRYLSKHIYGSFAEWTA